MFQKQYSCPDICKKYFEKYTYFSKYLETTHFNIPQVLSRTDNVISFEELDDFSTLQDIYRQKWEIDFKKIWEILHNLHSIGKAENYIHGDFCLQNILLKWDSYYVIDFESPKDYEHTNLYYKNTYYVDIWIFIMKVLTFYPLHKSYNNNLSHYRDNIIDFLHWYANTLDIRKVYTYTQKEIQRKNKWLLKTFLKGRIHLLPYIIISIWYHYIMLLKLKKWLKKY